MSEKEKELQDETLDQEAADTKAAEDGVKEEPAKETPNAEETAQENPEAAEKPQKEKGKKLGKKPKEDKKLLAMNLKIEELEDKNRRQLAEFENFRKRTEKEKEAMFDMGARNAIEKILPVVDNFERGLQAVDEAEKGSAFVSGMEMVYKQLMTELENIGVKPIEAVGKEFDPNLHNAVMQVESDEFESGMVAQEMQKGYTYKDTVLRHSMVAVVP
ncbi:MAG: nucleotide exchange factor GrpE [Lachnospiraceae bacterium]|nr:nucleotide exchange factor GrpE [Lachnospiraceae bacterium]